MLRERLAPLSVAWLVSWQLARAGEPGQTDLLGRQPTAAHFCKLTKTSVFYSELINRKDAELLRWV